MMGVSGGGGGGGFTMGVFGGGGGGGFTMGGSGGGGGGGGGFMRWGFQVGVGAGASRWGFLVGVGVGASQWGLLVWLRLFVGGCMLSRSTAPRQPTHIKSHDPSWFRVFWDSYFSVEGEFAVVGGQLSSVFSGLLFQEREKRVGNE